MKSIIPATLCIASLPFAFYGAEVAMRNQTGGASIGTDVVYGVFIGLAILVILASVFVLRNREEGRIPRLGVAAIIFPSTISIAWVVMLVSGQVISHSGWRLF